MPCGNVRIGGDLQDKGEPPSDLTRQQRVRQESRLVPTTKTAGGGLVASVTETR